MNKNKLLIGVLALCCIGGIATLALKKTDAPASLGKSETITAPEKPADDFKFLNNGETEKGPFNTNSPIASKQLDESISLLGDYLVSICDKNGKFIYRSNMDPKVKFKRKYNMLRHAGTIYSMVDYYTWNKEKTEVLDAAKRAMKWLQTKGFGKVGEEKDMIAIWSYPKINNTTGRPIQAKLGGAGLGLVAGISLEQVAPGTTPRSDLEGLGNFILYQQREDGSFFCKYTPTAGGRDDSFVSLYYPGEAALGLVMLYELTNNPKYLEGALKAIGYLANLRKGKSKVEPDHWALLATNRLLKHYDKSSKNVPRKDIEGHALQVVNTMITYRNRISNMSPEYGSIQAFGRTTPTATRLEGLQAYLETAKATNLEIPAKLENQILNGTKFLIRSIVRSGKYKGAMPRAIMRIEKRGKKYNDRATELRIDYNQHALSALIAFDRRNQTK